MPVYNVLRPVVETVEAASPEEAERILVAALGRAGFQVYDGELCAETTCTFEAEAGTEVSMPSRPAAEDRAKLKLPPRLWE